MIHIKEKQDCCGCEVCSQACPKNAISMNIDSQGFLYPKIDKTCCIDCHICEKVCPQLQIIEKRIPAYTYAVKNSNENIREKSSSGGVFSLFAEDTIKKGGVVYGAVFDKNWDVVHARIDKLDDIWKLRGSKYVQSRMTGIYQSVKRDLEDGIPVLFSGCHCHVAALLGFLRKKYSNLTTVDVICGGVPSPRIWRDSLEEEISANGKGTTIQNISFRDKRESWRNYHFKIDLSAPKNNGSHNKEIRSISTNIWEHTFMLSWLKQFITRPSCNNCRFRKGRSGSDFTIADYWCIERVHPEFSDDKGVSLLLTYRSDMPSCIKKHSTFIQTDFLDAASGQTCLLRNHLANPFSYAYYFLHDKLGLQLSRTLKVCLKLEEFRSFFHNHYQGIKYRVCRRFS